jgi:hypothetical protein
MRRTFNDIANGTTFLWCSNLGGQDEMQKVGENEVCNLRTGKRSELSRDTTYFVGIDPVRVTGIAVYVK